jgi:hypothetical protein
MYNNTGNPTNNSNSAKVPYDNTLPSTSTYASRSPNNNISTNIRDSMMNNMLNNINNSANANSSFSPKNSPQSQNVSPQGITDFGSKNQHTNQQAPPTDPNPYPNSASNLNANFIQDGTSFPFFHALFFFLFFLFFFFCKPLTSI